MESLFTDRALLFHIIMNMDIEDLYKLYQTNHVIQDFLNEKYTMTALSEKYNTRYLNYDNTFFDLVWDVLVTKIGFYEPNVYLKDEIIRAVAVIHNRFLNSGDKITGCDYEYDYEGEYTSRMCQAAMFLKSNGFNQIINQILTEMDDLLDYEARDKTYIAWLKLLKIKALAVNSNQLLDKPFTNYTGIEDPL